MSRWRKCLGNKDSKEARNRRIFDMWMACYTQEEIGEAEALSDEAVRKIVSQLSADLPEVGKASASSHLTDFEVPIYNIWKQQEKIAAAIGFSRPVVSDLIESVQSGVNETGGVSAKLDENGGLTKERPSGS